jgi:mRNA interferase HigB
MRVNVIKEQSIRDFMARNASSRGGFEQWLVLIRCADWVQPEDMARLFPSADLLGSGSERAVFDIGGNKYRMICTYHFGLRAVSLFVKWIGTHAEYDRLCKQGRQYHIEMY